MFIGYALSRLAQLHNIPYYEIRRSIVNVSHINSQPFKVMIGLIIFVSV